MFLYVYVVNVLWKKVETLFYETALGGIFWYWFGRNATVDNERDKKD